MGLRERGFNFHGRRITLLVLHFCRFVNKSLYCIELSKYFLHDFSETLSCLGVYCWLMTHTSSTETPRF